MTRRSKVNNMKILVVDDEPSITRLLSRILSKEGYQVETAFNGMEALELFNKFRPDLVISDLKMPGMTGLELLRNVKKANPETDFIILTAFGTIENAVEAMKEGAADYLIKPLKEPEELRIIVAKIAERKRLLASDKISRMQLSEDLPPQEILFCGMPHVLKEVEEVAGTGATVLLLGESGTGKSVIAKAIHQLSRKRGPFVSINCAAIPENLIESELFGHEKGAFTGAVKGKRGKFELANEGTIFLDEMGEMPLPAQSKLLRVLQERSFERVGGTVTLTTNARVIAATNQDLQKLVAEKRFRQDLFYRLNVFPITLPPLRERPEAVDVLTKFLVQKIAAQVGKKIASIPGDVLDRLKGYEWPGNIRELHNILERAVILSQGEELELPGQFQPEASLSSRPVESGKKQLKSLKELEKEAIKDALEQTSGHRRRAAEILGISLRSLQYKLKEYGLKKD